MNRKTLAMRPRGRRMFRRVAPVTAMTIMTITMLSLISLPGCERSGEPAAQQASNAPAQAPTQAPTPAIPAPSTQTPTAPVTAPTTPASVTGVGPQITFDRTSFSFGEVWDLEKQEVTFRFTNTGDAPLEIEEVKTSCGCTAAELDKRTFLPGEGDEVRVSYKPKGFGAQQQSVRMVTNASAGPEVTLNILANVKPFVTLSPNILQLGNVRIGEPVTARFTVTSADPNISIERITTNNAALTAKIVGGGTAGPQEPGAAGEPTEVEITLDGSEKWGNFYGAVILDTRGRIAPGEAEIDHEVRLAVNAKAFGELVLDDLMFRLVGVNVGESFERRIRVTRETPAPFNMRAEITRCTIKNITIDVEAVREPGIVAYDLVIRGDTIDHRGPVRGDVIVHTDVPGEERLTLQIAGKIEGA